jgi:hypothetical protein
MVVWYVGWFDGSLVPPTSLVLTCVPFVLARNKITLKA